LSMALRVDCVVDGPHNDAFAGKSSSNQDVVMADGTDDAAAV
jgi:hypothetical protein